MSENLSLLKVDEFAKALGVTPAAIRRWILEQKITTVRLGRLVRVPAGEVQRLINAGTRPAQVRKAEQ